MANGLFVAQLVPVFCSSIRNAPRWLRNGPSRNDSTPAVLSGPRKRYAGCGRVAYVMTTSWSMR